jgi:beta-mannosidase
VFPIDKNWEFKQADKEDAKYLSVGQFPTNVHLDLLHHKLIPDPFIGKNENQVQWVGEAQWVYRTTFSSPEVGDGAKAVLAFDGLDTFATVVLNGEKILETDNMFIPERVDVTKILKSQGENELIINFDSAYLRGCKLVEKYPDHKWGCWNGDVSRLAVRKSQFHWVSFLPGSLFHDGKLTDISRGGTGDLLCSHAGLGDQSTWRFTNRASSTSMPISMSRTRSNQPASLSMRQ